MQKYINERIHNKIYSKIHHFEYEANYYFKNRHKGLAGPCSVSDTWVV